ncbi:MAG TPA: cache domain-containing protein [Solirubrobacterales bacterium]|nr:cache domain-containing protein [Solirubrobacterales bacterium]
MRSKLIPVAIAALLATGPVVGVSAGPAKAQANRAERLTGAAGAELGARRVTRDLHRVFAAARKDLVKLSRLDSVRAQDGPACSSEIAARLGAPRFTVSGATNRAGDVYCASQPLTSPANLGDRPYFIRAIGTRGYAVGDFQLGRVAGAETLGMGFPVRGANGVINGLVFSSMSVSWLDRHVGGKRPRGALDVLVVDEHGTVLARAGKRQTRPGRNLAAKSLVRAMLANDEGIGEFRLAGRPVISAFETVLPTGGAVHVAVSVRR